MSQPTGFEREYYAKLIGYKVTGIIWQDLEGRHSRSSYSMAGKAMARPPQQPCSPTPRVMGLGIWITTCEHAIVGFYAPELH